MASFDPKGSSAGSKFPKRLNHPCNGNQFDLEILGKHCTDYVKLIYVPLGRKLTARRGNSYEHIVASVRRQSQVEEEGRERDTRGLEKLWEDFGHWHQAASHSR
jgi:hypothetical protein